MKIRLLILLFISLNILAQDSTKYYFEHNKLALPINNKGVLADVSIPSIYGMEFNGKRILFSGGFLLSGFSDETLWANGQASSFRIEDYLPGSYKNSNYDNLAKIYLLKSSDEPFSASWQEWKNAVKLGADFYDGNNDGIYTPIDKNNNGKWDLDEDRPDLLGDQTAWCVYKDAVSSDFRIFINVEPQGIEIQQTIFASSITESFKNTIFVRYRIENSGLVSDVLDSVYFGAWSDPDIGDYVDDLIGCDTTINSGFAYNDGSDDDFGQSAPALLISILQGAPIYVSDSTFIDINNNGYFDSNDSALTSAYANNGFTKGITYIKGATNSSMTSFFQFYYFPWGDNSPGNKFMARANTLGLTEQGNTINACEWEFGEVANSNCQNIDGLFIYSGDPVLNSGWINNKPSDQVMMVNTGPFQLEVDEPIDIVVAYTVGYYESHSSLSLKDAKQKARNVKFYFLNNAFEPVLDEDTTQFFPEPIFNFELWQNYPNPFNPTTKIIYTIPFSDEPKNVTLKVYNLLGQEVTTLVNEVKQNGIYYVDFSAENLSNGVYIYSLSFGNFRQSRKLMVLK